MKSKQQITVTDHTGKREKRLPAFVWNCGFFSRGVYDEKIIEMWRKSPARSLDDPEDETFYDVECLTPMNWLDESMTSLSRIRRITYVSSMSVPPFCSRIGNRISTVSYRIPPLPPKY